MRCLVVNLFARLLVSFQYDTSKPTVMTLIFHPLCRLYQILTQRYNIPEQQSRDPGGYW